MRPMANEVHTTPGGTCATIAASRAGSGGAPYGMPMHSWYIGGSSTRPSATSLFANHRCPVSKISSSGRTPSSWIRLAPARSMSGVLT